MKRKMTIEELMSSSDTNNMLFKLQLSRLPKEYTIDDILDCDEKANCITIKSIGANYHIDLGRIKNKNDLLEWVEHLCRKNGMDMYFISEFISRVEAMKRKTGW